MTSSTPVPSEFQGTTDVVVAVVPYVPTSALQYLPHDVRSHEAPVALPRWARRHGPAAARGRGTHRTSCGRAAALLLELGGDQAAVVGSQMSELGYGQVEDWSDEDGDVRGIEATLLSR